MDRIHLDLRIIGKVQGVWYRKSAVEEATRLGLVGYAMNLPDGSVHIEVEGARGSIDRFVEWCAIGPPRARVDEVRSSPGALVGYEAFETRH